MILKKVDPFSCAKVSGVLYVILGFLMGLIFSLFAFLGAAVGGDLDAAAGTGIIFGAGAIVLLPIFYGLIGFIGGALMAWLYNVVASWIGGIKIELEQETPGMPGV